MITPEDVMSVLQSYNPERGELESLRAQLERHEELLKAILGLLPTDQLLSLYRDVHYGSALHWNGDAEFTAVPPR